MKHFLSLGAGVQSSTMALMAKHGEITPMPDAAIFADTQAEPASVYHWLDWLEKQLPFPVYRVSHGSLSKAGESRISKLGKPYLNTYVPFFLETVTGKGMLMRKCTRDFKVLPIQRKVLQLVPNDESVTQWIGISLDEAHRMKDSRHKRIEHRWPLVDMGIRRGDCLRWMSKHDYPVPPRSACVFCPYHSDREWERLRREEPEEFQKAVAFEKQQQSIRHKATIRGIPFLHISCKPLDQVTFVDGRQTNLFGNECEGMCGV